MHSLSHPARRLASLTSLLAALHLPLFAQPTPAAVPVASSTAPPPGTSQATDSPRERGRILQKRNPIASEYQAPGTLGRSPGSQADGEGNDFRRFFPTTGDLSSASPQTQLAAFATYHSLSREAPLGGELRDTRVFGSSRRRWAVEVRANVTAADRLIEHYEAVWAPNGDHGPYYLQRPRFSQDTITTRTRNLLAHVEHEVTDGTVLFAQVLLSDYWDDYYRNRIELNTGQGEALPGEPAPPPGSNTLTHAAYRGAGSRRFFSRTKTARNIARLQLGGRTESTAGTFDYGVYHSRWDSSPHSDGWNFAERGLDLAYTITDPYWPDVRVTNGTDLDASAAQSTFNDLRATDTRTRDTDWAGRVDWTRRFDLPDGQLWLGAGSLYREKERRNATDKAVYLRDRAQPLALSTLRLPTSPGLILHNRYFLPIGLDTDSARARVDAGEPAFAYAESRSIIESYQDSYTTAEAVTGGYVVGTWKRGRASLEFGLRGERTRTNSLGTIISPAATDTDDGPLLAEVRDSGIDYRIRAAPGGNRYTNWLPSLGGEWQLSNRWTARVALFEQLMRPQYFDTVRYRRVAQPTLTISEGNPALQPTTIRTVAVALDHRTPRTGELSLEVYSSTVNDFFYSAQDYETLDGNVYTVSRVDNGDTGTLRGVQVQWSRRWTLAGLSLTPAIAYTYSDSSARLPNRPGDQLMLPERSRHLARGEVTWTFAQLGGSLESTAQSRSVDEVGPTADRDTYRDTVFNLDGTVWWRLNPRWRVVLAGQNLTDAPERAYEGHPLRVTRNQLPGTTWRLRLETKF